MIDEKDILGEDIKEQDISETETTPDGTGGDTGTTGGGNGERGEGDGEGEDGEGEDGEGEDGEGEDGEDGEGEDGEGEDGEGEDGEDGEGEDGEGEDGEGEDGEGEDGEGEDGEGEDGEGEDGEGEDGEGEDGEGEDGEGEDGEGEDGEGEDGEGEDGEGESEKPKTPDVFSLNFITEKFFISKIDDYNRFVAILPQSARKIIYKLLKVSDSRDKRIQKKSKQGTYTIDIKVFSFSLEKIYREGEAESTLQDYVELDRELLKYFLLRITSHPEYLDEENGIDRYAYDMILPYTRLMKKLNEKRSINLFNFSPFSGYHILQNIKRDIFVFYNKENKFYILFEINHYQKTFRPIIYSEKDLLFAKYEFSKLVVSYMQNDSNYFQPKEDDDFVMKDMLGMINILNQMK